MKKFKSYIGLTLPVFFIWVLFIPGNKSMGITPLDQTFISWIIENENTEIRTAEFRLLRKIISYNRNCPLGPETNKHYRSPPHSTCDLIHVAPDQTQLFHMRKTFEKHDPGFIKIIRNYNEAAKRSIATYPRLLPQLKKNYIKNVYLYHSIYFLIIMLMILFRNRIGGAITWPFVSTLKLIRKIHDKV